MGKQARKQVIHFGGPAVGVSNRLLVLLARHNVAIAILLVSVASARIVATYAVFNHTADEPSHIACGLEWLDKGIYRWEPQHPPMARVAAALGVYLSGIHSQPPLGPMQGYEMQREGLRILYSDHQYQRNLTLARFGNLPFFWLACLVVYWWGRRYCGSAGAVLALFLFSLLPPVLAHAGLATTDMALTAFTSAAFLAGLSWVEQPRPIRALVFGLATAGGILSKFSFLAFLPASTAFALGWYAVAERPPTSAIKAFAKRRAPTFLLAVLVTCLACWGGYRFSTGRLGSSSLVLPAPELFQGIRDVAAHNREGHPGYLLGERSWTGFLLFFPVALAVKTPIPFLALFGAGLVLLYRRSLPAGRPWLPLAFAAGILGVGLFSRIDIGVRHILPIYVGFSLVTAAALLRLAELADRRVWLSIAMAILVFWLMGTSILAHPDYLPYFNALAGDTPENILVDSDLDWGQDMNRLGARLRAAGAEWVMFTPFVMTDLQKEHGFPLVLPSDVPSPSPGWNAVSVTVWKQRRMGLLDTHLEVTPWPDKYKAQERVGKSILLWYFPPGNARPKALVH